MKIGQHVKLYQPASGAVEKREIVGFAEQGEAKAKVLLLKGRDEPVHHMDDAPEGADFWSADWEAAKDWKRVRPVSEDVEEHEPVKKPAQRRKK